MTESQSALSFSLGQLPRSKATDWRAVPWQRDPTPGGLVLVGLLALAVCVGGQSADAGTLTGWGADYWGVLDSPAGLTNQAAGVAVGQYHSLVLEGDGTVLAWGGDGSDYQEVNQVPPGLSQVTAIAAGDAVSLALRADGQVVAWGPNFSGQTNVPAGLHDAVAIAAGAYHSLALRANGEVVAWGQNDSGQVDVPSGLPSVRAVAGGGWHSLALKRDGTVAAWGYNGYGQTDVPAGLSNVKAIAAGLNHSLALRSDGTVVAWGWNNFGQTDVPPGLGNVVAIAAGAWHNLALKWDGTIVAWGRNDNGQCDLPVGLPAVAAVSAGTHHNLAVLPPENQAILIRAGSTWKYHDSGADLGTAWRTPEFNDGSWPSGPAQLGFGDGDEATVIDGGPSDGRHPTVYFRREFGVANVASFAGLILRLVRDDGAVVYLNGIEVFRSNMPGGAVTYSTPAVSGLGTAVENLLHTVDVDPGPLVNGLNVLAVEVHQADLTSSDLSFDLELVGQRDAAGHLPLATALDTAGLFWTSSQSWPWFGQDETTHDGVDAAESKRAVCDETSWLSTTVEGPGTVSFWWKADIQGAQYSLGFHVVGGSGVWPQAVTLQQTTDWRWETCTFGPGPQTLTWAARANCDSPQEYVQGWLDHVVITGPGRESAPFITTQPCSTTVEEGAATSFQVVAAAHPMPSYQWLHDGTTVPGATSPTLLIESAQLADAGNYSVVVSNTLGSVTSQLATLTVLPLVSEAGCAGSLDPSFTGPYTWPYGATDSIAAMTVQPDGKVIIAGTFQEVGGTPQSGIARLHADGALDTNYMADPQDVSSHAKIVQPDGKVLLINSDTPPKLTRYWDDSPDPAYDYSFRSGLPAEFWPRALALQPDGRILVAGGVPPDMNQPPFAVRQAVLRLLPDGALDFTFSTNITVSLLPDQWSERPVAVYDLLLQPDGRVYLGGFFNAVNGVRRTDLARLHPDGRLDLSFEPAIEMRPGWDFEEIPIVTALALASDGKLLIAGTLYRINGMWSGSVARLHTTRDGCPGLIAFAEPTGYARENDGSLSVQLTRTGDITLSATIDFFTQDRGIFGQPYEPEQPAAAGADYVAQQGRVVFAPGETTQIISIPILDDAELESSEQFFIELRFAGGASDAAVFNAFHYSDTEAKAIIWDDEHQDLPGSVDDAFADAQLDGPVHALALAPDGTLLVAGSFSRIGGAERTGLARLTTDGFLVYPFQPALDGPVFDVEVHPDDGAVLIAGEFTRANGVECGGLARLHPDGRTDTSFAPNIRGPVTRLRLLPSGQILISGSFGNVDGQVRYGIARLNANGALDPDFDLGSGIWLGNSRTAPNDIVPQPDGKVIVCGSFDHINGVVRQSFSRLHLDGAVDTSFGAPLITWTPHGSTALPLADGRILLSGWTGYDLICVYPNGGTDPPFFLTNRPTVATMLQQPDGKILYGGNLRLNLDGTDDPSYFVGTGLHGGAASALVLLPNGDLVIGGSFTSFNGFPYSYLVRLNADAAPPPPNARLNDLTQLSPGQFRLQVHGPLADPVALEVSNDLKQWDLLGVFPVVAGEIRFADPESAQEKRRFYRLRLRP